MGARTGITAFFESEPSPEDLDTLLGGLADLTVSHPQLAVQRAAVSSIRDLAEVGRRRDQSRSFPALFRIFEEADDLGIQRIALLSIGSTPPEDRSLEFLGNVATADDADRQSLAVVAIDLLSAMGRRGRGVLKELYEEHLVPTPRAQNHLQALSQQGFKAMGG